MKCAGRRTVPTINSMNKAYRLSRHAGSSVSVFAMAQKDAGRVLLPAYRPYRDVDSGQRAAHVLRKKAGGDQIRANRAEFPRHAAGWLLVGAILVIVGVAIANWAQTRGSTVTDVSFKGPDDTVFSALLYRPPAATVAHPAPGILAVHGYTNTRETQSRSPSSLLVAATSCWRSTSWGRVIAKAARRPRASAGQRDSITCAGYRLSIGETSGSKGIAWGAGQSWRRRRRCRATMQRWCLKARLSARRSRATEHRHGRGTSQLFLAASTSSRR